MINTSRVINIENTSVRDKNNIGTNKEQYRYQQNNKTNNHTGEKQIIEGEKYRSKMFRHLRSIESRVKRSKSKTSGYARTDKDPSSKNSETTSYQKTTTT